jgi:proteasome lid subunit RPN8/RPN11
VSAHASVHIPAHVQTEIHQACEAAYPLEACGVLFGHGDGETIAWTVTGIRAAPNQHGDDQRRRYQVPPEFQMLAEREAEQRGEDVIGYYHSHPDHPAQPSEYDRVHAWFGYVYAICAVIQGRSTDLNAFTLKGEGGAFATVDVEQTADSIKSALEVR